MEYKYHCQYQAESFADSVLPVPEAYPLRKGLPEGFPASFARLCSLMKEMYRDMAQAPEAYGLMLVEIGSGDRQLIRKAGNTIHRLFDTWCRLCECGEVRNRRLTVSAPAFRDAIKKAHGAVSNPVSRYELILSRLAAFGFVISDFEGKPFGKSVEAFTIGYPDYPEMIDTMKAYCDCWYEIRTDRSSVKIWPEEFHHHSYRFDYKVTADRDQIPIRQWISDESRYYGYPEEINDFYLAFYEYSLRYKGIKFNGDYIYRSKRIARDLQKGQGKCALSLKLKSMEGYASEIGAAPDGIKKQFTKSSCAQCGFQGATDEYCKFRLRWSCDGTRHEGCAFLCFEFDDFDLARVPDYWRLLELDYRLAAV